MRRLALAIAAAVLLASALAPRAEAQQVAAFTQTQVHNAIGWSVNTTRGWSFTVSAPVLVQQLGFWDDNIGTGLSDAHPVGIWRDDGTLLTSATVPAGISAPLDGTFRWVATNQVLLTPGTTYVIGAYWSGGSADPTLQGGSNVAFDSRVTLTGGREINFTGLFYPSLAATADLTPNFKAIQGQPVPALRGGGGLALAALLLGAVAVTSAARTPTRRRPAGR